MKKIILLSLLILGSITIAKAQEPQDVYYKGSWHAGPIFGFGVSNTPYGDFIDKIKIDFNIGGFGGYSFTDLIGAQAEIRYTYKLGISGEGSWQYLTIPASFNLQFLQDQHFGVGLQYSQCLNSPQDLTKRSSDQFSYLSAFIEYSYMPNLIIGNLLFLDLKSKWRSTFRIGYALTPLRFTYTGNDFDFDGDGTPITYKNNPFFIEYSIRYDISQLFNKYKEKRSSLVNPTSKNRSSIRAF